MRKSLALDRPEEASGPTHDEGGEVGCVGTGEGMACSKYNRERKCWRRQERARC